MTRPEKAIEVLRRMGIDPDSSEFKARYIGDAYVYNLVNILDLVASQRDEALGLLKRTIDEYEQTLIEVRRQLKKIPS